MAEPQQPTEQQLSDAKADADKASAEAAIAKWEGDFTEEELEVKYKRDDKKAEESEDKKDEVDTKAEQSTASTSDKDTEESVGTFTQPESLVTVADPGEYQPADYSFEVTLSDGKTVKVTSPEEADKLADDPDNFETPRQLSDFLKKSVSMSNKLERDKEKWEAQKATFDEQTEAENDRKENIDNIANEIGYLVSEGLLPEVAEEYKTANWQDPEVAKQPGVKEQLALLDYMVKENTKREKAKIKPLTSMLDAFNGWSRTEEQRRAADTNKADADEKRQQGDARRAASSRVASVSPSNQAAYVPKGIAVGNPNVLRRGSSDIWND